MHLRRHWVRYFESLSAFFKTDDGYVREPVIIHVRRLVFSEWGCERVSLDLVGGLLNGHGQRSKSQ